MEMNKISEEFSRHQHLDDVIRTPVVDDEVQDLMRFMGYNTAEAKEVSTGTTIMACEFQNGVILAADSRTSTGDFVANRTSRKISRLTDTIFVLRSGSAADTQALTGIVKNYLNEHAIQIGEAPTVNTAANLMKLIAYNNKDSLTAGLIVGGWDQINGPQVYAIPLGGTKLRRGLAIGGSGSGYITGLVDHLYKPNMTKAECQNMVSKCVSHAMARDGSSGGLIRMITITKEAVEENVFFGNQLPYRLGRDFSE
jgi:20S proteasome subunit beta 1